MILAFNQIEDGLDGAVVYWTFGSWVPTESALLPPGSKIVSALLCPANNAPKARMAMKGVSPFVLVIFNGFLLSF